MNAITERREPTALQLIRRDLEGESFEHSLAQVLPQKETRDRFRRVATTALMGNGELAKCDRASFLTACIEAATDGLIPDGREGAIVPYKGRAQWQPMVWGLVKLVRNTGELLDLGTYIVRDSDVFENWIDESGPHFKHVPNVAAEGKPIAVYAYARLKNGGVYVEVMSWKEVERFKSMSRASSSDSPWAKWPEEMAKVRPLKRLAKRLPMSAEAEAVFRRDDEREGLLEGAERVDPIRAMNEKISATSSPSPAPARDPAPALEHRQDDQDGDQETSATPPPPPAPPPPTAAPGGPAEAVGEAPPSFAQVADAINRLNLAPKAGEVKALQALIEQVVDDKQQAELGEMLATALDARRSPPVT